MDEIAEGVVSVVDVVVVIVVVVVVNKDAVVDDFAVDAKGETRSSVVVPKWFGYDCTDFGASFLRERGLFIQAFVSCLLHVSI
jgi:hypothetical protein